MDFVEVLVLELFVVENISPVAHTLKDFQGKRKTIGFSQKAIVSAEVASLLRRTGQFKIHGVDWDKIVSVLEKDISEPTAIQKLQKFRPPTAGSFVFAVFPEEEDISIQRWFFSQLVRLSRGNDSLCVYARDLPKFARFYFGTHNIGWIFTESFFGKVDVVIGFSQSNIRKYCSKFGARGLQISPSLLPDWETSDQFLNSRSSGNKNTFLLLSKDVPPKWVQGFSDSLRIEHVKPDDAEWIFDAERARLLSRALIFLNLEKTTLPFYEREAKLCGAYVVSDANLFSDIGPDVARNEKPHDLVEKARTIRPARPISLSSITTLDLLPKRSTPSRTKEYDVLIVHSPSLSGRSGADKATIALKKHLSKEWNVGLMIASTGEKSGPLAEIADFWAPLSKIVSDHNKFPVASLYIVSDSLIPAVSEVVPKSSILGYLHYLGDLADDKNRAIETLKAGFLQGVKILSPSRCLAEKLREMYSLDVEHCVPKYDFPQKKSPPPSGKNRDMVFVPVLYNSAKDLQFLHEIAELVPEANFVVGDCRAPKSAIKARNVKVQYFENVQNAFSRAKIVLVFSTISTTLSISAWEALAAGIPVIAEDKVPFKDLFDRFRLPRNPDIWASVIRKNLNLESYAWGGTRRACRSDFMSYMEKADRWDILVSEAISRREVGFSVRPSPYAGVQNALECMKHVIVNENSDIVVASVLDHDAPHGCIGFIASSLSQLALDGQNDLIGECASSLSRGRFSAIITFDTAIARLLNMIVGDEFAFALPVPIKPIRGIARLKPLKTSILFRSNAPRKDFFFNLLLAAEAGVQAVEVSDSVPPEASAIAQRMGVILRFHPLYSGDAYRSFLSEVKVGLQVTLSESFNYTAFDHFQVGTPCLVSEQTRCIFDLPKRWRWLIINQRDLLGAVDVFRDAAKMTERDRLSLAKDARKVADALNIRFKAAFSRVMRLVQRRAKILA